MDEVSARAEMADAVDDSRLAVTVPRSEVERVLATDEEVDLVLDVVRTNGEREERRVFLAWDREALRRLVDQSGERIVVAIDPKSLQEALGADVEAHGLREMGATLAIVVATAAGGAGAAGAVISPTSGSPSGSPAIEATVDTSGWQGAAEAAGYGVRGTPSDTPGWQDAAEASGYGVRGTPSDVAADPTASGWQDAAEASGYGVRGTPSDVAADPTASGWQDAAEASGYGVRGTPSDVAADPAAGIENVRAEREAPAAAPDPSSAIENVRSGGSAVPDTAAGIENVRADRTAPDVGDGGTTISAPSAGVTAALAGGAVLTLAGAAFALRRRREPEPAT
jgi:hypothetical protein